MSSKLGRLEDARTLLLTSRRIVGGQVGHAPSSSYVETFWLPVLGPSTTWLIRLLNQRIDRDGENVEIGIADAGFALGLGERPGKHSPLIRALSRAADFDLVMRAVPSPDPADAKASTHHLTLLVRRTLPSLSSRLVERLPPALAREHHELSLATSFRLMRTKDSGPSPTEGPIRIASDRVFAP